MTDEWLLLTLTWHCLNRPRVRADTGNFAFSQPLCRGLTRASVAFVELDVVLLPQLHVPGMEQDHTALAGLFDVLFREGLFDVLDRDDIADGQPFPALQCQNIQQHAAREERFDVVDTELLEAIGATDLLLGQAVIVAYLVPDHDPDMAKPVKLRPYLADFTREHLIVVH